MYWLGSRIAPVRRLTTWAQGRFTLPGLVSPALTRLPGGFLGGCGVWPHLQAVQAQRHVCQLGQDGLCRRPHAPHQQQQHLRCGCSSLHHTAWCWTDAQVLTPLRADEAIVFLSMHMIATPVPGPSS